MENAITVLTVLSFGVIVYQAYIMHQQIKLMNRQDSLLQRRAVLSLNCVYNPQKFQFEFTVKNTGNKSAEHFYWHIFVPIELSRVKNARHIGGDLQIGASQQVTLDGNLYKDFASGSSGAIYPTRDQYICNFPIPTTDTHGTFRFAWQIACDDGVFPERVESSFIDVSA